MSHDLLCSIAEIYNAVAENSYTLTMSMSAAVTLAAIFDEGGIAALRIAMTRTMQ